MPSLPTTIPRVLWQTWRSHDLGPREQLAVDTWIEMNPEFEHRLCDDDECRAFVYEHFPHLLEVYDGFELPVERADLWRYLVLYHFGGVYTDLDTRCLQPIRDWGLQNDDELVICTEYTGQYCQWTMVAAPGHPAFAKVIEQIHAQGSQRVADHDIVDVIERTGPRAWTRAIAARAGGRVRVLPTDRWCWTPQWFTKRGLPPTTALAVHDYWGTWKGWERPHFGPHAERPTGIRYAWLLVVKVLKRVEGLARGSRS